MQTALQAVGLDASGISATDRAQFRALLEGVNVSTQEGRTQLATLLNMRESFAGITDYLVDVGGTLGTVSAQAPDMVSLGPLFACGTTHQVDAVNGVPDAVDRVNDTLSQMCASGGSGLVVNWGPASRDSSEVVNLA